VRVLLLVPLLLSACDKPQPAPAARIDPARLSVNGSTGTLPVAPPKRPSPLALPPLFEGRWGKTPADCDISRSDTRGAMIIRGDRIDFYAATGHMVAVERRSPTTVAVTMDVKEGGRQFRRSMIFTLVTAATELLRVDAAPPARFRYTRC